MFRDPGAVRVRESGRVRLLRLTAPRASRGLGLFLALVACSAPDDGGLYVPFAPGETEDAGTAGAGGGSAGAPALGGSGGGKGEGQGGSGLALGGTGGTSVGAGGAQPSGLDAGADAGASPDAAPAACEPSSEVCDGLDNDCDDDVDPDGTCDDDCVGIALGGRGYMYCAETVQRPNALASCEDAGMHLAWLETPDESAALRIEIAAADLPEPTGNAELLTQIGGSDAAEEGVWSWVGNGAVADGFQFWQGGSADDGGEVVDDAYAAWAAGEPTGMENEHCAAVSVLGGAMRDAGEWDDRSCNEQLPYVCEAP